MHIKKISKPYHPVPGNENYYYFDWVDGNDVVSFSATTKGKGLSCHVGTSGKSKLRLREAINDFCDFAFLLYRPECIFAVCGKQSVVNLTKKCGFKLLGEKQHEIDGKMTDVTILARYK